MTVVVESNQDTGVSHVAWFSADFFLRQIHRFFSGKSKQCFIWSIKFCNYLSVPHSNESLMSLSNAICLTFSLCLNTCFLFVMQVPVYARVTACRTSRDLIDFLLSSRTQRTRHLEYKKHYTGPEFVKCTLFCCCLVLFCASLSAKLGPG